MRGHPDRACPRAPHARAVRSFRQRDRTRPGAGGMTVLPLVKASACGNDFLLIDGMHAPPDLVACTRQLCDRHNGVGADGVEWLFPTSDADVRARLLNADGSEAEISGN